MRNSAFAQNVEFMRINRPPLSPRYLSALWPPPPSVDPSISYLSFTLFPPRLQSSHETEAVKGAKEKWLRR